MKRLIIDIETAPNKVYTWGLYNQNVGINQIVEPGYTMCYAAKWYGERTVFFDSIHQSDMKSMLESVFELLEQADAVIHYNGEKFDIPTLNREFAVNRLGVPSPFHHIDLLKVCRKRFKFPSNKLDYVSQAMGFESKVQHKGMDLWKECMEGNEKAWKVMERYNKQDVKLLEPLYDELLPWIKNHPNHALFMDTDRPVCTNCGSNHVIRKGTETTLTQVYERFKCKNCDTPLRGRTTVLSKEKKNHVLTQSKL